MKWVMSKPQKVILAFVLRSSALLSKSPSVKVGGFLIVISIVRNAAMLIRAVPKRI